MTTPAHHHPDVATPAHDHPVPEPLLDSARPYKPLDVGNTLVAASVHPDGRLVALSGYHPEQGYLTLGGAAPFPDDRRHDPAAVRAFRAGLASADAPGVGFVPEWPWEEVSTRLLGGAIPCADLRRGPLRARVVTWAPSVGTAIPGIVQRWTVTNDGPHDAVLDWSWRGPLGLSRASMTQLTEGGVIPAPPATTEVTFAEGRLAVTSLGLGAAALVGLVPAAGFRRSGPSPVDLHLTQQLHVPAASERVLVLGWALASTPNEAVQRAAELREHATHAALEVEVSRCSARWDVVADRLPVEGNTVAPLLRRGLLYALQCCALSVEDATCILTDHQILPLSWTRDAYYVARMLCLHPDADCLITLRRHLHWLFEIAERPEGWWARAYLPNGRIKDQAFQLDQQCYPFLELADYLDRSGDERTAVRYADSIPVVLDALMKRLAPDTTLVATDETPADDPLPLPYHFSSQVLLWHTLRRLAGLAERLGLDHPSPARLVALADDIATATHAHLIVEHDGRRLFAYAGDAAGGHLLYGDANDLPTVLAPLWGFCSPHDEVWRATMAYALSPANTNGWFEGGYEGLGSTHTPGPWPLGDVQELVYARLVGDGERVDTTLARLAQTACWDGALPEAREPDTGAVKSRHWFAWPNAALFLALLDPEWTAGS